jgi:hypothetical protein
MSYGINDDIGQKLKQAAGLPNYTDDGIIAPVPDHIAQLYERVQRRFNRIGGSEMSGESLAIIVGLAEMLKDIGVVTSPIPISEDWEDPEFSIPSKFLDGTLKVNDPVIVEYKDELRPARILNVRQDRSQVQVFIDGDEIARWVHPRTVSLPIEEPVTA